MRRRISRLWIVVVSMFALVSGLSVSYSQEEIAEDCEWMEDHAGQQAADLPTCQKFGDCGEILDSINFWNCRIAECWNIVDGVCSADDPCC